MLKIGTNGIVSDPKIIVKRYPAIERGGMTHVSGIIVHQTGAPTLSSTFHSYQQHFANGAHFLIDKDGSIYQTASVYQRTRHVGKLKARCIVEKRCDPVEIEALKKFNPAAEHAREMTKSVPFRFPSNNDSIGIELVGESDKDEVYVAVTAEQNASLKWLVAALSNALSLDAKEVFRHPQVSRKNLTEASTAQW